MRRVLRWTSLVLGLVLASLLAVAVGRGIYRVIWPDPVPVTVYRLARGTVEETVTNSKAGTVKARRRAKISPEVGGRVESIGFRSGAQVRRGGRLLPVYPRGPKGALALAGQDLVASPGPARRGFLAARPG